jgi:hypothetical protein
MKRLLALAAVLALAAPNLALADRLDNRLLEEAPKLVAKLKEKKYGNVGVLRFQVNMPGQKPTYAAPLSGNVVSRLETGLIIHVDEEGKPAMGVIRDAGMTAARQKVGAWPTNGDERKKLFGASYPLAWGRSKVKPDVFLTGKVELSKDLKKTTMTIQSFDKGDPVKFQTLAAFTIPTDRSMLRDLGCSIALPRAFRSRAIKKGTPDSELDSEVIEMVQTSLKNEGKPKPPDDPKPDTTAKPDNVGGVTVKLLVGGEAAKFVEKDCDGDAVKWEVVSPAPGKKIAFELTNTTDKKLGVVLRLNGMNVINMQKDVPEFCGKIILAPGKKGVVTGFIEVDEAAPRTIKKPGEEPEKPKMTVRPFGVLVGAEAAKAKAEFAETAGLIEVDVFEEGGADPELQISPRGLPPTKEKVARETYKGLRTALLQSSGLKTKVVTDKPGFKSRELIVPRPAEERVKLKGRVAEFPKPSLVARVAVRVVPAGSDK